jgi:hypothetical protein
MLVTPIITEDRRMYLGLMKKYATTKNIMPMIKESSAFPTKKPSKILIDLSAFLIILAALFGSNRT